jgi:hypothetical protein
MIRVKFDLVLLRGLRRTSVVAIAPLKIKVTQQAFYDEDK